MFTHHCFHPTAAALTSGCESHSTNEKIQKIQSPGVCEYLLLCKGALFEPKARLHHIRCMHKCIKVAMYVKCVVGPIACFLKKQVYCPLSIIILFYNYFSCTPIPLKRRRDLIRCYNSEHVQAFNIYIIL